jgi:membrane fusion protein (multidrug efflux system)
MKKAYWILIICLVIGGGYYFWQRQTKPVVEVVEVASGTAVNAVTGTIKIFASIDIKVPTEREGRLSEVTVNIGDRVEKGQVVAIQDSELYRYRLDQERARYEAALEMLELPLTRSFEIEAREAEVEALRLEVELGQTSRSRLEESERDLRRVKVHLEEDKIRRKEAVGILQARVQEMELELERMTLTAPFNGVVTTIYAGVGSLLGHRADVLRIISDERMVEMTLNEEDFVGADIGQRVTLRLASFGTREFHGKVDSIEATADSEKKTRKLFVSVEGDQSILAPGLTGEGYLIKAEKTDAIIIPRRAIRGNYVWVVENGIVRKREVVAGFLTLNEAEISSGLQPGELVVTADQDLLTDGEEVRLANP